MNKIKRIYRKIELAECKALSDDPKSYIDATKEGLYVDMEGDRMDFYSYMGSITHTDYFLQTEEISTYGELLAIVTTK